MQRRAKAGLSWKGGGLGMGTGHCGSVTAGNGVRGAGMMLWDHTPQRLHYGRLLLRSAPHACPCGSIQHEPPPAESGVRG